MDVLDAASSSSSRQSSSSPGEYPSRSSTPSQSSVSSDFLSSDSTPLTPWTPYTKHSTVSLLDEDRKPALDPYYSLGMSNNTYTLQTTPPRGFLLEDLMQEDAYEYASRSAHSLYAYAKLTADTLTFSFQKWPVGRTTSTLCAIDLDSVV